MSELRYNHVLGPFIPSPIKEFLESNENWSNENTFTSFCGRNLSRFPELVHCPRPFQCSDYIWSLKFDCFEILMSGRSVSRERREERSSPLLFFPLTVFFHCRPQLYEHLEQAITWNMELLNHMPSFALIGLYTWIS